MTIEHIEKENWQDYFSTISHQVEGLNVEMEIDSLEFGTQIESNKLNIRGLTYDPRNNLFEVSSDDLEHLIPDPEEIYVDTEDGKIESIKVEDDSGNTHILTFLPPLSLPYLE